MKKMINDAEMLNYILQSAADIDRAIHTRDRTMLNAGDVEKIKELLS